MDREAREEQILKELEAESDRGCVLVGASALDVFLEELLRTALVRDSHVVKHAIIPMFETMGPLATFSAKIKLAYALGLITKSSFTDLEKIRRIRNIASHEHSAITFESQQIVQIGRTLEGANLAVPHLPISKKISDTTVSSNPIEPKKKVSMERMRFTITVAWIAGSLEAKTNALRRNVEREMS